jgi:PPOX class probable F420-dependent enzyme
MTVAPETSAPAQRLAAQTADPPPAQPRIGTRIPDGFRDLIDCPRVAALTTVMPDGYPQTTAVWCNFEGIHVLVNVMRGFRKETNMRRNPHVTLLCYDPRQPHRSLEVRGLVVEMTVTGAREHLDYLSSRYTGYAPFFGKCVPASFEATEVPVLCRILPTHVVALDARRDCSPSPGEASCC